MANAARWTRSPSIGNRDLPVEKGSYAQVAGGDHPDDSAIGADRPTKGPGCPTWRTPLRSWWFPENVSSRVIRSVFSFIGTLLLLAGLLPRPRCRRAANNPAGYHKRHRSEGALVRSSSECPPTAGRSSSTPTRGCAWWLSADKVQHDGTQRARSVVAGESRASGVGGPLRSGHWAHGQNRAASSTPSTARSMP